WDFLLDGVVTIPDVVTADRSAVLQTAPTARARAPTRCVHIGVPGHPHADATTAWACGSGCNIAARTAAKAGVLSSTRGAVRPAGLGNVASEGKGPRLGCVRWDVPGHEPVGVTSAFGERGPAERVLLAHREPHPVARGEEGVGLGLPHARHPPPAAVPVGD